jgi:hypothetical protein
LPKAFSVVYEPFHTLIDISPSSASIGQTLTVHFKGLNTNFKTALNQTITISAKGAGKQYYTINPNSVNVIDDSTLEAEFSIPSVIFTGNYNISVSNSTDGYMYVTNGFHIDGLPVPEIISLSPDNANGGQVLDVTITGNNTHFKPNGTQVFFGFNQATGTTTVNSTKVISETVIEANVTIPSTLVTGGYYVYVEDSIDGVVLKDSAFYVNGVNTPSLLYISPSSANAGDSVEITLTGKNTHFLTGTNIFQIQNANNNSNVIVYSKILISETEIKLLVGVPPNTIKGYYSISLTNSIDGNLFLYNALYINGITPPDLYSVSPSSAAAGQTLDVSITGTNSHFMMGSNTDVAFTFNQASSTIIVNSISPVNDTLINANITVPTNAVNGNYDVIVENSIDGKLLRNNGFYVNANSSSYVWLDPNTGLAGQTMDLILHGHNTYFKNGITVDFNLNQPPGTTIINSKKEVSDTIEELNITIPSNTPEGIYSVNVTDSIGGTLHTSFKVLPKSTCHVYYKTTYKDLTNVFTLEMDSITTASTSFHWDFGDGTTSSDVLPEHTFAVDKLYNVCLSVTNFKGDSCTYCHEMGKDSLGNPIFKNGGQGFSTKVIPYSSIYTSIMAESANGQLAFLFPNPVDDLLTVQTHHILTLGNTILTIYSIDGRSLFQKNLLEDRTRIDVSGFAKGLYILRIANNEITKTIKFMKE